MPEHNLNIEKKGTPNYWPDRKGHTIQAIVVHCSEGSTESATSWIQNIESAVSYHYLVRPDGSVIQFVEDEQAAWANGLVVNSTWPGLMRKENPNLYTLSVAYAGTVDKGPTYEQVIAMAALINQLSIKHSIPLDTLHVIPHNQIRADKLCPGKKCDMASLRYLASL